MKPTKLTTAGARAMRAAGITDADEVVSLYIRPVFDAVDVSITVDDECDHLVARLIDDPQWTASLHQTIDHTHVTASRVISGGVTVRCTTLVDVDLMDALSDASTDREQMICAAYRQVRGRDDD